MKVDEVSQTHRPHRILLVEDDPVLLQLNTKLLNDAGYAVEGAQDGAAAWDTLQQNNYDLMITDNAMPRMTGVELIEKVRTAGLALPIIMATGALPRDGFAGATRLQPAATLLKPYTATAFLLAVQRILCATVALMLLGLGLSSIARAQEVGELPIAVALSAHARCEGSTNGVTFTNIERGAILEQGAVIRTGNDARADFFFRRTGTTVRLQADTEIKLEKMTVKMKDGQPVVYTLLDLRKGRIFTVVRSAVAGNTLEISNAAGRSVVEGSGIGRYIITADGTHVAAIGSAIPIKLVGENGITVIAAGQQFASKVGKMLPVNSEAWVKEFIQLDELQAIVDKAVAEEPAPKS